MSELKPCPFCGGEAYFARLSGTHGGVKCRTCNSSGDLHSDEALAIAAWNRRAEPGWQPISSAPRTDFAWLIEAPGQRYLAVCKAPGDYRGKFYWTAKVDDALRFFNEAQADFTATAIRWLVPELWGFAATLGEAWPREHGWLSAASVSPAEPGWQPISSAPRDGTWFVAFQNGDLYPCEWLTKMGDEYADEIGWWDHFNNSFEAPTHWFPLPSPPIAPASPAVAELSPGNSSDLRGEEG